MEGSLTLIDPETSSYLTFVLNLTDTCADTCSILEKRQLGSAEFDKYDTQCLQACTRSYLKTAPQFSEKFSGMFLKGNPYLGPSGVGVTPNLAGEM